MQASLSLLQSAALLLNGRATLAVWRLLLCVTWPSCFGLQARVSDVAAARSCASVERHGACPSAGSFTVRLEGPATLWGALTPCNTVCTVRAPLHAAKAKCDR